MNYSSDIKAETLGERITGLRTLLGLSMSQLARNIGVTAPALWKWEHDINSPRHGHLKALAEALFVSVPELLAEHGEAPLQAAINQSKAFVADAAGTTPDRVTITIRR